MPVSNIINTLNHTNQSMVIKKQGQVTHLISKNRRIKIWHYCLRHASNIKIIRATFLVNDINFYKDKYDSTKVFVDSKDLKSSNKDNTANKPKSIQNMKKTDIKVVFILKTFKPNLTIDPILKSNLETSAIDPDLNKL